MVYIPRWITNVLFMVAFYGAIYQLLRFRNTKGVFSLQFFTAVFALVMILVVTLYSIPGSWLPMGFLAVAVATLGVLYWQMRYLPPRQGFD